jgi:hypothetical protein
MSYERDRAGYEQSCTEDMIRMRDPSQDIRRVPEITQLNRAKAKIQILRRALEQIVERTRHATIQRAAEDACKIAQEALDGTSDNGSAEQT